MSSGDHHRHPDLRPDRHQSADFVFTGTINNSGFSDGSTSNFFFWLYVLPVGFLLTMCTVTGYDASAHVAEETVEAEQSAAKGVWQSVFFSAVIGWFVLLAITFAAVLAVCVLAALITLPALTSNAAGIPVAFFAVVSIAVIGLYIAYVTPVYLRLKAGDSFQPGSWTLGAKYKWVNKIAVAWVAISVIIFSLPFTPAAVPWNDEFDWSELNYAPLMVGGVFLAVG
jgi:hypothetical protein